jgi:hypothetical protein
MRAPSHGALAQVPGDLLSGLADLKLANDVCANQPRKRLRGLVSVDLLDL